MKLTLALPAMNATNEQAVSAMHQIKSYLQSTMTQGKLNLMISHVHKEVIDKLVLADVANDFVSKSPHRVQVAIWLNFEEYILSFSALFIVVLEHVLKQYY